jgi:hypothetical protein
MIYPDILREQINKLNENLDNLNNQIKKGNESSINLQRSLIFWTRIMALAIIGQIITIILTRI